MFTLYYALNTCALASHIALKDSGAPYDLRRVDFRSTQQQSPDYVAINPKARVPALVTPRGILTETPAILAASSPRATRRRIHWHRWKIRSRLRRRCRLSTVTFVPLCMSLMRTACVASRWAG